VAEARTALGASATTSQIRAWIEGKYPSLVDAASGGITGQANDPLVNFVTTKPVNSDQEATLQGWEFAIQHRFWETGFGTILNYTIVESDTDYDNTLRYTVPQFSVVGVSNSANAVVYYDKNGIQARLAYNWRDEFLAAYGLDPGYIKAYGQFDASASYEFRKGFTAYVEGINMTNADRSGYSRNEQTVTFAAPGYSRYSAGVRYTF
jgi:TonB-dependent receptor